MLIRHANAQAIASSGKDFDRKLSEKGKKQCENTKSVLSKLNVNHIKFTSFSSSSKRTRETALAIFQGESHFSFHDNLYLASAHDLRQFIWDLGIDRDLLILGHNNGLSDLAAYFTGKRIFLKTGSFVTIQFSFDCSNELTKDLGEIENSYRCDIGNETFF
jgi:phosphohistidine phosphatase